MNPMSLEKERREQIESDMNELLGPTSVIEFCGNQNLFTGILLKTDKEECPQDLLQHLALQTFFTEVIKKRFGVNEEMLQLEIDKCYLTMEEIVKPGKELLEAEKTDAAEDIAAGDVERLASTLGRVENIMDGLANVIEERGQTQAAMEAAMMGAIVPPSGDDPDGQAIIKPFPTGMTVPNIMADILDSDGHVVKTVDTGLSIEDVGTVASELQEE